jgi:hypothetical protein
VLCALPLDRRSVAVRVVDSPRTLRGLMREDMRADEFLAEQGGQRRVERLASGRTSVAPTRHVPHDLAPITTQNASSSPFEPNSVSRRRSLPTSAHNLDQVGGCQLVRSVYSGGALKT